MSHVSMEVALARAVTCFSLTALLVSASISACNDPIGVQQSKAEAGASRTERKPGDRADSAVTDDAGVADSPSVGGAGGVPGSRGAGGASRDAAGRGAGGTRSSAVAGAGGVGTAGTNAGVAGAAGKPAAAGGAASASGSAGKPASAVCKAGQFKCVDDTVYECNAAGSEFVKATSPQGPCAAGLCNAELGKCNACVPRSVSCTEDGAAVRTCSDDGQTQSSHACDDAAPICLEGVCGECRPDSDPSKIGCAAGNECMRSGDKHMCRPANGVSSGLKVQFCHAGACKVTLAPGFDLDLKADWTKCVGSPAQAPLGADTTGVMLWPTALTDLVIPLADSGWFCKLAPTNGGSNGCIVNASQTARDLYIWGPIENTCTYAWGRTPTGIDATIGAGCGMCMFVAKPDEDSAEYAFNLGVDSNCRCPKIHFAAIAAKRSQ